MLVQIGMRACAVEGNSTPFFIGLINKNPIALDVAIKRAFPFTVKRMKKGKETREKGEL